MYSDPAFGFMVNHNRRYAITCDHILMLRPANLYLSGETTIVPPFVKRFMSIFIADMYQDIRPHDTTSATLRDMLIYARQSRPRALSDPLMTVINDREVYNDGVLLVLDTLSDL